MVKQTLTVSDMHCSNCAMRIESIEDELPGVRQVSASYQKGRVVVEYDERQVSLEAFIAAVKKKGYTAGR
jgi:copper chaperone CopZ